MTQLARAALLAALPFAASLARADEGMWTFDHFPSERVRQRYGFAPDPAWLDHVRAASARMAEGCSASFVSPTGLVVFNHHCAQDCIAQLSTARRDYLASGFWARTQREEVRCPELEIDRLDEIRDVTGEVAASTSGLSGPAWEEARRATVAGLEQACGGGDDRVRCEVVSLYHGGVHALYRYHRFQDTRLVFAPELAVASFGGDPDNFMFPRYDLDVAFVRVYEDGRPARTDEFLRWSSGGLEDGQLTFVSGNPGSTEREWTVAQLEYERDVALPERLLLLAEQRGQLTEFRERGPEERRIAADPLLELENSFKARRGMLEALLDRDFFAARVAAERALRAEVEADPNLREAAGAWDAIARALEEQRRIHRRLWWVGYERAFDSDLFRAAVQLLRGAEEREKENGARLAEYAEARLPELRAHLLARAPVHRELEILQLTFSLTAMREALGADDPFVRKVLGKRSPRELATRLVTRTRLGTDPAGLAERRRLWEGGRDTVDASRDPMMAIARLVDPEARAVRKHFEEEVESVMEESGERIARARFALHGTSDYPDATFTPRLSFGAVEGYLEEGRLVRPFTTVSGLFERATGREPFRLPASWLRARSRLDPSTALNFCTTNDIVGGNSGSPVVDQRGEIVGLAFDGNIQSLGGDYGFDPAVNRTVAVSSEAILAALEQVYGARRLVEELVPGRGGGRAPRGAARSSSP
ncbi:MAG TPA: S46 family peptidase [Anaeromyxobacter sp.]|nr:S46 family peptidase [Anaeromyxobacter sp.]